MRDDDASPIRKELRILSAEVRQAIARSLCADLGLDEDDLRSILREEVRRELEDSIVDDADQILRQSVMGAVKNEIYEEVYNDIYEECYDFLMNLHTKDERFLSGVQSDLRAELREEVLGQLRSELRDEALKELKAELRADPSVVAVVKEELIRELYAEIKASLLHRSESTDE